MEPDEDTEFQALRQTLRRLAPAPLPDPLRRRLASIARGRAPLADRILAAWTLTGALAACLIAALSVWQLFLSPTPTALTPHEIAQQQQTVSEYQKIVASR